MIVEIRVAATDLHVPVGLRNGPLQLPSRVWDAYHALETGSSEAHYGAGFRDATRILRLRAAVMMLSSPGATASDVARVVGYGSLDAMGRAFRDARLPAPSVVLDAVRYPVT